jgi:hypothetical protein
MVFGFFSRKPAIAAPATPAVTAETETVDTAAQITEAGPSNSGAMAPQFEFPAKHLQLHTPAPSIDDSAAFINLNQDDQPLSKPKPKKPRAKPKPKAKPKEISPPVSEVAPGPVNTPSPTPEDALVTDPSSLHALIASVPAQTLHAYALTRLNPTSSLTYPLLSHIASPLPTEPPNSQILTALTTFFSSLAPPPKLHCVRCHRGYFDLENNDTACRIAHDDDSAIVERVGLGKGAGTEYETLWGCCGSTVEGDGDMGPPDGWCYEGAHTVNNFI